MYNTSICNKLNFPKKKIMNIINDSTKVYNKVGFLLHVLKVFNMFNRFLICIRLFLKFFELFFITLITITTNDFINNICIIIINIIIDR